MLNLQHPNDYVSSDKIDADIRQIVQLLQTLYRNNLPPSALFDKVFDAQGNIKPEFTASVDVSGVLSPVNAGRLVQINNDGTNLTVGATLPTPTQVNRLLLSQTDGSFTLSSQPVGTAAYATLGAGANQVPQMDNQARYPAGDGSLITNVNAFTTGMVVLWSRTTNIPVGWLVCNGDAVLRTTYAPLFALLGTTYGAGNGSTTFNLPSLTAPNVNMTYIIRV
jgi:hypothetical protein